MSCRVVEQWLDLGMPEKGREVAMRHVAVCGACFEAFEAASGVEAALHAEAAVRAIRVSEAPVASPDFVANVMARVAAAEPLARKGSLGRRYHRIWIELATDPISVVAITAALVVAVWSAWHPSWFFEAGMSLAAQWWSTASLTPRGHIDLDPFVWIGIAIAATPVVVWAGWTLYRRLERTLLLLKARPTH